MIDMTKDQSINDGPRPALKLGARVVVDLLERNVSVSDFSLFDVLARRNTYTIKQLLSFLTELQRGISNSPYTKVSLKALIHQRNPGPSKYQLSRLDLGMINLVDAMYDEMLEKGRFDAEAWSLIAKTKIPVLKLIIQDLSFLFSSRNIARKFLNSTTLALISSPNTNGDPSRQAISGFVDNILSSYDQDISVVNTICIDAQSWFAGSLQRLEVVQEKIVRSESSKNRKMVAEPRVVELINRCFGETEQPEMTGEFVRGVWRDVLRAISIESGENSGPWKRAVGLTESMAAFYSECCSNDEGREKYQRFLPTMLKSVKLLISDFVKGISLDAAIEPFELIATALVAGAIPDTEKFDSLVLDSDEVQVFERKVHDGGVYCQLDDMQVGDWIRIKTSGNAIETCKLTIKPAGDLPWILVNQSGQKIAKKTRAELEVGIAKGSLQLIGKGLWVDEFLDHAFNDLSLAEAIPLPVEPVLESQSDDEGVKVEGDQKNEMEVDEESLAVVEGRVSEGRVSEDRVAEDRVSLPDVRPDTIPDVVLDSAFDINTAEAEEPSRPTPTAGELEAAERAASNLQVGGWVLLVEGFGKNTDGEERLKLAVVIRGGKKYIFVNRLGLKRLEIEKEEFLFAIATGDISIVDNGVQFSSALEKVVRNIQKEKR